MSGIIGFIITVLGTAICFSAKIILEKFRVAEPSDGNIMTLKIIGTAIAVIGALIVFLM